ncbi:uncharacterized protein At4g02000-like [Prunus dulcis]|nr:uncharacterized protein At4g02000-like [Prunus dulcis]
MDALERFLFSFKSNLDCRRVLRSSPWTFDKALLLLKAIDSCVDPRTITLDTHNFWVRVRRIPLLFLTPAMGEKLGNYLGSFIMVDHKLNMDCLGSFLRIMVGLKISEPLKRSVTLRLALDESVKLYEIEYERLPYFCLYCGRFDHVGEQFDKEPGWIRGDETQLENYASRW